MISDPDISPSKLCIDCTHYTPPDKGSHLGAEYGRCKRLYNKPCVVTGKVENMLCQSARSPDGPCGQDGTLYEPK